MNFLAHIYLSGNNEFIMLGNFIADIVKGNNFDLLDAGVVKGIKIHRQIDQFTDQHEAVKRSNTFLRPVFGKFSGITTDIFYDHFLALHWSKYSAIPLSEFAEKTYNSIESHLHILPPETKEIFRIMKQNNWLLNYSNLYGIERTMDGMARRTKFDSNLKRGADELRKNYKWHEHNFFEFFPDVETFACSLLGKY